MKRIYNLKLNFKLDLRLKNEWYEGNDAKLCSVEK